MQAAVKLNQGQLAVAETEYLSEVIHSVRIIVVIHKRL